MSRQSSILGALLLLPALWCTAQTPAKPLTQEDLLKQIEAITPKLPEAGKRTPAVNVPEARVPAGTPATAAASLFRQPPETIPEKNGKGDSKGKGPTEIVATEATFDQKVHQAVFLGAVVVTDPEFNVKCDKLTAYLKHEDPNSPAPVRTQPPADDKAQKSGGLDKAIAESDPEAVVTVTQDKVEIDGSVTHNVGHGRKVLYDASTGDITFYGRPDVQQGINQCIATADGTIMILNRAGNMRVNGPHRTIIKEQGAMNKQPQ